MPRLGCRVPAFGCRSASVQPRQRFPAMSWGHGRSNDSESEFAEAHIPGSFNIPLLNDAERIEIGTLYKKKGAEIARRRGLEVVHPKLQSLYGEILKVKNHNSLSQ